MLQYKSLLHVWHTANGRIFRHLPKFSCTMSKEDIDIKRVIVNFKFDDILMTDDRHKFSSNIFLLSSHFLLRSVTVKENPTGNKKKGED